ncbi:DEAD/DEAH box helicase [Streptomyces sp. NPDC008240]|uniref:DEAD/DEAH box helicase n=1 Tax=Streptomyces sp. NPDC008240 TaxID=3364822 RepID=UPI0036EB2C1A
MQGNSDAIEDGLSLLRKLGRKRFKFQAALAGRCLSGITSGERLLITAPTGSGKTLISQLAIALLSDSREETSRVLVVVPSRGLALQHFDDAAWMREGVPIALHRIHSDTPLYQVQETFRSYGVVFTTPITLSNRLSVPGIREALRDFDCAIFDEVDLALTVDEQDERQDTFPALRECMDARLPILGFTGTGLNSTQLAAWEAHGFQKVQMPIPEEWLPLTRVKFVGVTDRQVISADASIGSELTKSFESLAAALGYQRQSISWKDVKRCASTGLPPALQILKLCSKRLELFESFGSNNEGKLLAIQDLMRDSSPTLILSRFRKSASAIKEKIAAAGLSAEVAHGGMHREEIGARLKRFRTQDIREELSLILTRDLGGRGLDFPEAASACLFSPRSNYQTVAQELARIRSRRASPKTVLVLYYKDTEEEAKARRLGLRLRSQRYESNHLFAVEDLPGPGYELVAPYEGRLMVYEESMRDPQAVSQQHANYNDF